MALEQLWIRSFSSNSLRLTHILCCSCRVLGLHHYNSTWCCSSSSSSSSTASSSFSSPSTSSISSLSPSSSSPSPCSSHYLLNQTLSRPPHPSRLIHPLLLPFVPSNLKNFPLYFSSSSSSSTSSRLRYRRIWKALNAPSADPFSASVSSSVLVASKSPISVESSYEEKVLASDTLLSSSASFSRENYNILMVFSADEFEVFGADISWKKHRKDEISKLSHAQQRSDEARVCEDELEVFKRTSMSEDLMNLQREVDLGQHAASQVMMKFFWANGSFYEKRAAWLLLQDCLVFGQLDEWTSFLAFYFMVIFKVKSSKLLNSCMELIETAYIKNQKLSLLDSNGGMRKVFEQLFSPLSSSYSSLLNSLPLGFRLQLLKLGQQEDVDDGLLPEKGNEFNFIRGAPTWNTMRPADMEAWEASSDDVLITKSLKAQPRSMTPGLKLRSSLSLQFLQTIPVGSLLDVAKISTIYRFGNTFSKGTQHTAMLEAISKRITTASTDELKNLLLIFTSSLRLPQFPSSSSCWKKLMKTALSGFDASSQLVFDDDELLLKREEKLQSEKLAEDSRLGVQFEERLFAQETELQPRVDDFLVTLRVVQNFLTCPNFIDKTANFVMKIFGLKDEEEGIDGTFSQSLCRLHTLTTREIAKTLEAFTVGRAYEERIAAELLRVLRGRFQVHVASKTGERYEEEATTLELEEQRRDSQSEATLAKQRTELLGLSPSPAELCLILNFMAFYRIADEQNNAMIFSIWSTLIHKLANLKYEFRLMLINSLIQIGNQQVLNSEEFRSFAEDFYIRNTNCKPTKSSLI